MKILLALLAPLMAMAAPASAQQPGAPPARPAGTSAPAAINTSPGPSRTGAAPVPGANSFSENQARARIAAAGYTSVLDLQRDAQGVWRGTATRDGKSQPVSLDYQGNVASP